MNALKTRENLDKQQAEEKRKVFILCPECGNPLLAYVIPLLNPELEKVQGISNETIYWNCEGCSNGFDDSESIEFMNAISIKQPWAWLIIEGFKTLENRKHLKNYRGWILIHAGKGFDKTWFSTKARKLIYKAKQKRFTQFSSLPKGGIIGAVEITDSITKSNSPWFTGPNAFVLKNPVTLPFSPCVGQLGIFKPQIQ